MKVAEGERWSLSQRYALSAEPTRYALPGARNRKADVVLARYRFFLPAPPSEPEDLVVGSDVGRFRAREPLEVQRERVPGPARPL